VSLHNGEQMKLSRFCSVSIERDAGTALDAAARQDGFESTLVHVDGQV
jgi:hypothetical protein